MNDTTHDEIIQALWKWIERGVSADEIYDLARSIEDEYSAKVEQEVATEEDQSQ